MVSILNSEKPVYQVLGDQYISIILRYTESPLNIFKEFVQSNPNLIYRISDSLENQNYMAYSNDDKGDPLSSTFDPKSDDEPSDSTEFYEETISHSTFSWGNGGIINYNNIFSEIIVNEELFEVRIRSGIFVQIPGEDPVDTSISINREFRGDFIKLYSEWSASFFPTYSFRLLVECNCKSCRSKEETKKYIVDFDHIKNLKSVYCRGIQCYKSGQVIRFNELSHENQPAINVFVIVAEKNDASFDELKKFVEKIKDFELNVKSSIFLPGQNTNSVDTWRFEIRRANCVIVLTSVDVFDNAILREAIEYAANRAKNKDLQLYLAELTPYTWDDLEALNIQKPYVLSERPMSSESSREVFWTTVKSKFHAFLEKIHLSY